MYLPVNICMKGLEVYTCLYLFSAYGKCVINTIHFILGCAIGVHFKELLVW